MSKKERQRIKACEVEGLRILHSYGDWTGNWYKDYDWSNVKGHKPPKGFMGCAECCDWKGG